MFGSIYIGLSGLAAYSRGLQVVSNNISNMNSLGFRSSNVTFGDIYSAGGNGGLGYGGHRGGGQGVAVNDITLNFNAGELRQTGRDLDLSVDGNGFFVLLDGEQTYYTRTGSFVVADDGYVVLQGTDYRLAVLDATGRPAALNIDGYRTNAPLATDRVTLQGTLSSQALDYTLPNITVIGTDGREHTWSVGFTRDDADADWAVTVTEGGSRIGEDEQALRFTPTFEVDPATHELTFADPDNGLSVTLNFDTVRAFTNGAVSSLAAGDINGHPTGTIATLQVNAQGELEIGYDNEETRALGPIALADFRDLQALEQRSGGLFTYSGFGHRQYLAAADSRVGSVLGGQLEGSNVDLGAQFGDLILIQRGFQASSQVISVTNDMIQQLFGIRGQ